MLNTASLLSLLDQLWPGVVTPDRVLSMDQIELNYVIMLNRIVGNQTLSSIALGSYSKIRPDSALS